MPRSRLASDPTPSLLHTISQGGVDHEREGFVFGTAVENIPFSHWSAHQRSFWGWYSEEPNYHPEADEVSRLKELVANGLSAAGFHAYAEEISRADDSDKINQTIIRQYTASNLYNAVNSALRLAHGGVSLENHPLIPWMLQFNCAMRVQPKYDGVSYRGVRLKSAEIELYVPQLMFSWAPFISASKNIATALDTRGNVIFDITPGGSHSLYNKRNPFDISGLSELPDEQEVIFPLGCTYRVLAFRREGHRAHISLQTVDWY